MKLLIKGLVLTVTAIVITSCLTTAPRSLYYGVEEESYSNSDISIIKFGPGHFLSRLDDEYIGSADILYLQPGSYDVSFGLKVEGFETLFGSLKMDLEAGKIYEIDSKISGLKVNTTWYEVELTTDEVNEKKYKKEVVVLELRGQKALGYQWFENKLYVAIEDRIRIYDPAKEVESKMDALEKIDLPKSIEEMEYLGIRAEDSLTFYRNGSDIVSFNFKTGEEKKVITFDNDIKSSAITAKGIYALSSTNKVYFYDYNYIKELDVKVIGEAEIVSHISNPLAILKSGVELYILDGINNVKVPETYIDMSITLAEDASVALIQDNLSCSSMILDFSHDNITIREFSGILSNTPFFMEKGTKVGFFAYLDQVVVYDITKDLPVQTLEEQSTEIINVPEHSFSYSNYSSKTLSLTDDGKYSIVLFRVQAAIGSKYSYGISLGKLKEDN